MTQSNRKRRRSGFTLLEILVVIGIILVLVAMAVIGYNVVERSAAGRATKTTLADLHAMLSELDAAAGSGALPKYTYQGVDAMGNPVTLPQNTIGAVANTPDNQVWTIGDVTSRSSGDGSYNIPLTKFNNNIMVWTQRAMATLMSVPANQAALSQLPSKLIAKDSSGNPISPPVLLDGWGNPIIYVPGGGLVVYVSNPSNSSPLQITITSHDGRPFFASAGPDGDFGAVTGATQAKGDDNVYSIEK
jgi:prepilin-type N-terminal cleavage/methylation domain-containing protein